MNTSHHDRQPPPLETRMSSQMHGTTDGIDARGPRVAATITAALLLVVLLLGLSSGQSLNPAGLQAESVLARWFEPASLGLTILFALFVWGAVAGVSRHPFGVFFARVIKPRLSPASVREPEAPPTFAQAVGAAVTGIGLVLHVLGVPYALVLAAAAAFLAAFLNAAFGFCLGCELYLFIRRLRRVTPAPAR